MPGHSDAIEARLGSSDESTGFGTRAVRAGLPHDPVTGALAETVRTPTSHV